MDPVRGIARSSPVSLALQARPASRPGASRAAGVLRSRAAPRPGFSLVRAVASPVGRLGTRRPPAPVGRSQLPSGSSPHERQRQLCLWLRTPRAGEPTFRLFWSRSFRLESPVAHTSNLIRIAMQLYSGIFSRGSARPLRRHHFSAMLAPSDAPVMARSRDWKFPAGKSFLTTPR